MKTPFGRNEMIALAIGSTAGLAVISLIIYRGSIRRKSRRLEPEPRPAPRLLDTESEGTPLQQPVNAETLNEMEAEQQALAAVEAVVQRLSPEQQMELRNQLDQVLSCVAELRSEVAELRGGLQDIALQIVHDVKKGVEESQQIRRRRHVLRERTESTSSSSIYFTCSQGMASTYEETSEGGYSTAYAESDYTDHDTDREETVQEPEEESEEEEDESCATVLNLHKEDSQEEIEVPSVELSLLLAQSDILHTGDARLKAEGFQLLLQNRTEYEDNREFLWRMARAYVDMYESTEDRQEKKMYAQQGLQEAELALKKNRLDAECHKWFAVLIELTSKYESIDGKLKSSHILKEHLDRAISLKDNDPMCFYLLGRWYYEVTTLHSLEQKVASACYHSPMTSTLHDALENFLKAEELSPSFSRIVRLYIAKCHKELGNITESTKWSDLAVKTPINANNDEEMCKLEAELGISASKTF